MTIYKLYQSYSSCCSKSYFTCECLFFCGLFDLFTCNCMSFCHMYMHHLILMWLYISVYGSMLTTVSQWYKYCSSIAYCTSVCMCLPMVASGIIAQIYVYITYMYALLYKVIICLWFNAYLW